MREVELCPTQSWTVHKRHKTQPQDAQNFFFAFLWSSLCFLWFVPLYYGIPRNRLSIFVVIRWIRASTTPCLSNPQLQEIVPALKTQALLSA